jgi:hypothetical protein
MTSGAFFFARRPAEAHAAGARSWMKLTNGVYCDIPMIGAQLKMRER